MVRGLLYLMARNGYVRNHLAFTGEQIPGKFIKKHLRQARKGDRRDNLSEWMQRRRFFASKLAMLGNINKSKKEEQE